MFWLMLSLIVTAVCCSQSEGEELTLLQRMLQSLTVPPVSGDVGRLDPLLREFQNYVINNFSIEIFSN